MTDDPKGLVAEALKTVDGDWGWLCDQLEQWPVRVHPERTTSDSYLRESAAKIIRAAIEATAAKDAEIETLKARLETDPDWPGEETDGIACHNDTISILDKNILTLKARATKAEAKLVTCREALGEAIETIENKSDRELNSQICCSGHECGCRGSTVRDLLVHDLRQALRTAPTTGAAG